MRVVMLNNPNNVLPLLYLKWLMNVKQRLFLFFSCICAGLCAQEEGLETTDKPPIHIGFNVGAATEILFPLTKRDYFYETRFVKLQYQQRLWTRKKWDFELLVEPSYYHATHQLTNLFFIKPSDAPNFQELRDKFTQRRTFYELALNIGMKFSLKTDNHWKPYVLLSSGPMVSSIETERLARGFAFSDVLAVGTQYQFGTKWRLDARFALRHNSSAGINRPNLGHNSGGFETGISYKID